MRYAPMPPVGDAVWHRLLQRHAGPVHVPDHLLGMELGTLGRHTLAAIAGLAIHLTNVRRACGAAAPPLTLHQLYERVFRELAAGHQGARPFRARPVACRTTQSCAVLVRPGPRPMRDVPCAGAIAPCPVWMRARESGIALWRWRRQCHSGPPVARHGLQDTGLTPAMPRYYSPGLPKLRWP